MYILLTSKFVFNAKDYNEILRRNKMCKVYFPKKLWENLSPEAMDLCSKMLQKYPDNRISATEALEHPWFKKHNGEVDVNAIKAVIEKNERTKNIFNNQQAINIAFDGKEDDFNALNEEEEKDEVKGGLS